MILYLILGLFFMLVGMSLIVVFCFTNIGPNIAYVGAAVLVFGFLLQGARAYIGKRHVVPNRSVIRRKLDIGDEEKIAEWVQEMFIGYNFKPARYGKESVLRLGGSFFKIRNYAKFTIVDHEIIFEAWYSAGIGSWINTEVPMDDMIGSLTKYHLQAAVEDVVEKLDRILDEAKVIEE